METYIDYSIAYHLPCYKPRISNLLFFVLTIEHDENNIIERKTKLKIRLFKKPLEDFSKFITLQRERVIKRDDVFVMKCSTIEMFCK
jgi:hypothetical protein